nr:FxLYD domain-containing protein [Pseudomonas sp. RIT-PI-S]
MAAVLLGSLLASSVLAEDLKLRNVQLVDAGHITSIVGTVINTSDHLVKAGYLDFEVIRKGEVVARETVEVPDMEAGQAWRIWQPVQHNGKARAVAVRAHDPQMSVSAAVVPYPGTVVAQ